MGLPSTTRAPRWRDCGTSRPDKTRSRAIPPTATCTSARAKRPPEAATTTAPAAPAASRPPQFDFLSNGAENNFEGWYVDDATVSGALLSPANANAAFTGAAANELVGSSVSGIGDFNRDGKKDFAVSRPANLPLQTGQTYL